MGAGFGVYHLEHVLWPESSGPERVEGLCGQEKPCVMSATDVHILVSSIFRNINMWRIQVKGMRDLCPVFATFM